MLITVLWWVFYAALAWVLLVLAFFAAAKAEEVVNTGWTIPKPFLYALYVGVGAGWIVDILFNVTWGSWIFRAEGKWFELPREWTLSNRVTRHIRHTPSGRQRDAAEWWFIVLNRVWPHHIRR